VFSIAAADPGHRFRPRVDLQRVLTSLKIRLSLHTFRKSTEL
jgi:hypothetical protein